MRINVSKVYFGLKGEPLSQNGVVWSMGEVLKHVLLAAPADPTRPYDATENQLRLEWARKVEAALVASHDGLEDSEVDFPVERVAQIKTDVCRLFGPIIAGQVVVDLDG